MLERPEHFCKATCHYWVGKCTFTGNRKYPCDRKIQQVVRQKDGTLIKFRILHTWYRSDWTEIPAPKPPNPSRAGCC
jgi:hypothetical protein